MNHRQALKIAAECIAEKAKGLSEYANRYHANPDRWPELRRKHERYLEYIAAIEIIEGIMSQGRLF